MKKLVCYILTLSFLFAFASCSKETDAFLVYYPVRTTPRTVDPQIASGDTARMIVTNIYDGLVYVTESGSIACAAAERYDVSPDGLRYTFYLRRDAQWRMAKEAQNIMKEKLPEPFDARVTAYDFVFALRRAVTPATGSDDAVLLSAITNAEKIMAGESAPEHLGVRALSDYVLEIDLREPQPGFLYTLARPVAMPCNERFFEACGGRYGLSLGYVLSNGPFYFYRWREDYSLRLIKNEDYTGPRPPVAESVSLYENTDSSDVLSKLENNDYNAAYLDDTTFAKLKKPANYTAVPYENTMWAVCFNMESELFSNLSLRRAIALSLASSTLCGSSETPSERMVPPFCEPKFAKTFSTARPLAADEAEAQRELNTALTALGKSSVEVTLLCAQEHESILRLQMQQWQRTLGVNITVRLSPLPFDELQKKVTRGDYAFAFYPLTATGIDVRDFYKMFLSGSQANVLKMKDPTYDEAFKALLKQHTQAEIQSACAALEQRLLSQAAYIPVYNKSNYLVTRNNIEGLYLYSSPDTVYFTSAKPRQ